MEVPRFFLADEASRRVVSSGRARRPRRAGVCHAGAEVSCFRCGEFWSSGVGRGIPVAYVNGGAKRPAFPIAKNFSALLHCEPHCGILRPVFDPWGSSSVGRASRSQRGGREFESLLLHHQVENNGSGFRLNHDAPRFFFAHLYTNMRINNLTGNLYFAMCRNNEPLAKNHGKTLHTAMTGAGGGTRTLTHSRAADFESAASAISPLRPEAA